MPFATVYEKEIFYPQTLFALHIVASVIIDCGIFRTSALLINLWYQLLVVYLQTVLPLSKGQEEDYSKSVNRILSSTLQVYLYYLCYHYLRGWKFPDVLTSSSSSDLRCHRNFGFCWLGQLSV
ncbi:hypothetical protein RRG08_007523 [Elysia crispata]|uniref:Uncharacterized protein n=1 Tax=Elysia crispata TaxID=231223 RepID=A0AAE0YYR9_9GAST|nr:hypothetical protein RRG08_007523 [Elysia crispata]